MSNKILESNIIIKEILHIDQEKKIKVTHVETHVYIDDELVYTAKVKAQHGRNIHVIAEAIQELKDSFYKKPNSGHDSTRNTGNRVGLLKRLWFKILQFLNKNSQNS